MIRRRLYTDNVEGREVLRVDQSHLAKRELRQIMDEPGHSELYHRRKSTVEPVFGQIKAGMGFRRFQYRGQKNVRSEWNLVCAAFNIKKIAALLPGQRRVTSEQGAIRSASKRSRPGFLLFRSLAVRFIRPTIQWASVGFTTGPRHFRLP